MGNLKGRVERLEGGWRGRGAPIIIVYSGETTEEAWQRHLAEHPEDEKAEVKLIFKRSGQGPPGAPPTTKAGTEIWRPGPGARSSSDN